MRGAAGAHRGRARVATTRDRRPSAARSTSAPRRRCASGSTAPATAAGARVAVDLAHVEFMAVSGALRAVRRGRAAGAQRGAADRGLRRARATLQLFDVCRLDDVLARRPRSRARPMPRGPWDAEDDAARAAARCDAVARAATSRAARLVARRSRRARSTGRAAARSAPPRARGRPVEQLGERRRASARPPRDLEHRPDERCGSCGA